MMFTCIECEKQFHHTQMDLDERACYECLEGTEVHSSRVLSSFGTYVYYISDNEPNLEQLQSIVGGNIEVAYDDGDMQIICVYRIVSLWIVWTIMICYKLVDVRTLFSQL